jgi:hypothetical protein
VLEIFGEVGCFDGARALIDEGIVVFGKQGDGSGWVVVVVVVMVESGLGW